MNGAIASGVWSGADDDKDMITSGVKEMHAKGALLQRTDGYTYYWLYPNIIEGSGDYTIKCYVNGSEITTGFTVDYNTGIFTFTEEIDETHVEGTETVVNRVTADFYYLISTINFYKYNETTDTCWSFSQVTADMDLQYVNPGDKFYVGVMNAVLAALDNGFPGKQVISRQTDADDNLLSFAERFTRSSDYLVLPLQDPCFIRDDAWTADAGCTFAQSAVTPFYNGSGGVLTVATGGAFKGITQTVTLDEGIAQAAFICFVKPTTAVNARITITPNGGALVAKTLGTFRSDTWYIMCVKSAASTSITSFDVGIYPQGITSNTGTINIAHACLIKYPVGESIC